MKPTQAKWWVKCLGFTLSVDVLFGVIMLLYSRSILSDVQTALLMSTVCLIAAPLYFFVKGDAEKTPLYMLITCVSHATWISAIGSGLSKVFDGWEVLVLWIAGIAAILLFTVIILMDTVIWVWHKIFR